VSELSALLASLPENTLQNPYFIVLNTSNITGIGTVLYDEPNKYVSLDLSGSTITAIPDLAFFDPPRIVGCETLTGIILPNSVTSIGGGAFMGCLSLANVTIPDGVTSIGDGAFGCCISLASVTIPNSVTSIGIQAFVECFILTSVTIPNSVTSIGDEAFAQCYLLTGVTIPNSVTSIGGDAFGYCTSLTAINVDATNPAYSSLDGVLYNKGKTVLYSYPVGKTVSSFSIPNSVTSIEKVAFAYCASLTNITIPSSVTSIGRAAFSNCTSLTNVKFEGTILSASFGNNVFDGDLRAKFYETDPANGTPGTYMRQYDDFIYTWTKQ